MKLTNEQIEKLEDIEVAHFGHLDYVSDNIKEINNILAKHPEAAENGLAADLIQFIVNVR